MESLRLSMLEDRVWSLIKNNLEPKFSFLGSSPLLHEAFLRIASISHPFFGRAKLCVLSSESAQFSPEFEKLSPAVTLGLIRLEIVDSMDALCHDSVLITDQKPQNGTPGTLEAFVVEADRPSDLVLSENDPCRYVQAFLGLYGSPLERFQLPKEPISGELMRDWHFYGPSRDLEAYRFVEDELRLGLSKNDGSLFPQESSGVLMSALKGQDVPGKDLYEALKLCYRTPCLLRDMAAYQHSTWILRTLVFSSNLENKRQMIVSYPALLAAELAKEGKRSPEESFADDRLYSDYLVPLYFLRTLIQ